MHTSAALERQPNKMYERVDALYERVQIDGQEVLIAPDDTKSSYSYRARRNLNTMGLRRIFNRLRHREEERRTSTFIACVVPAHNEQLDINRTLKSLLRQTRPIDKIVVVVNNTTDKTAEIVKLYAEEFPHVICVDNPTDVTRHGREFEVKGKVAALNYFWQHFVANKPSRGSEEFILGVDADVVLAENCVELLEQTLLSDERSDIGGVRAAYGFEIPEDADFRTRGLIRAQQLDFAATELSDQLRRNSKVNILGGQATLFRRDALDRVAADNKHTGPWHTDTAVEDAYLTREFERNGYIGVVNPRARATVGAMKTPKALQGQRLKWQNGHLEDLAGDTKYAFSLDRHRWGLQFVLAWNLALRVGFFALLCTSLRADMFVFNPLWLIPLGLAMCLNLLVVLRMHDRTPNLLVRGVTYVLPELHVWRTLGVWLLSLPRGCRALFAGGRADLKDWVRQARAENHSGRTAVATWIAFYMSVAAPTVLLLAICVPSDEWTSHVLALGWQVVGTMSVISSVFMLVKIMRILKNYSQLSL